MLEPVIVDEAGYLSRMSTLSNIDRKALDRELHAKLQRAKGTLTELLEEAERDYEDEFYRFYHQSFKVAVLQSVTNRIADEIERLADGHPVHYWFAEIVNRGSEYSPSLLTAAQDNPRWMELVGPTVDAFGHAHYFLRMMHKYAHWDTIESEYMESGWAALTYLFGHR